jgi:hypothetical protein
MVMTIIAALVMGAIKSGSRAVGGQMKAVLTGEGVAASLSKGRWVGRDVSEWAQAVHVGRGRSGLVRGIGNWAMSRGGRKTC